MTARFRRMFVAAAIAAVILSIASGQAGAAEAPVGLGSAASFAVLAGTTVTNTGPTHVTGDLGVSPGSAVTGFPPGTVSNGGVHAADVAASQAQSAVTTAYNDAAGRPSSGTISADLGGQTLSPGVYSGGALALNGTLVLNGQGDPSAVFILQAASTLVTGSASVVALSGGAQACNIFWKVGSSATLGTNSTFAGTVLALTAITANTGASVAGRLLARNAAVTLDTNSVTAPTCSAVPGTTTTTTASTTTTIGSTTTTSPVSTTSTTSVGVTSTTAAGLGGGIAAPPSSGSTPGGGTTPELPRTGVDLAVLAEVGGLVLVTGSTALLVSRRRATSSS